MLFRSLNQGREWVEVSSPDRVGALTKLQGPGNLYLYSARVFEPALREQLDRADSVMKDYQTLQERARIYQLQFNAALLLGALVIVGLAIFVALRLADRLVRPLGGLVTAAGRVEGGDFSARVDVDGKEDEIGVLAAAFNRMTGRLEEQTGALKAANTQLDTRRAFIEEIGRAHV